MISCTSASSSFCWPQWEPEWWVRTGCALTKVTGDSWNDCHLCVVQVECKSGGDLWSWRSFPSPKLPSCFIRTELGLVSLWEIFVDHVPEWPMFSVTPGRSSRVCLSGEMLAAQGLIFFYHLLRACEKYWVSYHSLVVQIQVSTLPHLFSSFTSVCSVQTFEVAFSIEEYGRFRERIQDFMDR